MINMSPNLYAMCWLTSDCRLGRANWSTRVLTCNSQLSKFRSGLQRVLTHLLFVFPKQEPNVSTNFGERRASLSRTVQWIHIQSGIVQPVQSVIAVRFIKLAPNRQNSFSPYLKNPGVCRKVLILSLSQNEWAATTMARTTYLTSQKTE